MEAKDFLKSDEVINALLPIALQLAPAIGAIILSALKKYIRNNISLSKEEKTKFLGVLEQANLAAPSVYLLTRGLSPTEAENLYNELKQQ